MIDRRPEDSGETLSDEMRKARVRVAVLEITVSAVTASVKTLRRQINGDDVKR